MPVVYDTHYKPPHLWRNGHFNSIITNKFRKVKFDYDVARKITPDGDYIDLYYKLQHSRKAAVLIHGLESSSEKQYVRGLARPLYKAGWDIIAINLRGCSGDPSEVSKFYHSGFTEDVELVINDHAGLYDEMALFGFSLGGNMALKYLGDPEIIKPDNLKYAASVSAPTKLVESAIHLDNTMYRHLFISSLVNKGKIVAQHSPDLIDLDSLNDVDSLIKYDELVTAPIHGFDSARDYYEKASSAPYIPKIKIKTLIVNALDDPFFPNDKNPIEECSENNNIRLVLTNYGGHLGFYEPGRSMTYAEKLILDFLKES